MQEATHHGQLIREYREARAGITQEELARLIGKSRRTIVTLEQVAFISDVRVRRALAWALQIPPQLLGLPETTLPEVATLTPVDAPSNSSGKGLSQIVFETFNDNLRLRLDQYYVGSALSADKRLDTHIGELSQLCRKGAAKDRTSLLLLLSHNYQLKGLIARDQLQYGAAEGFFRQASLLAQEAGSAELNALTMARLAVMYVWQDRHAEANSLYETARELTKRSSPALRAHIIAGHAEVQGRRGEPRCFASLDEARALLRRVDMYDDPLLLLHSTRTSERAIEDCWSVCHSLLGNPEVAIECFDKLDEVMDWSMTRMRARIYRQYAEALFVSRDMSCCFYATEALKLARAVGSQYNILFIKKLASQLNALFPRDERVKELVSSL